MLPAVSNLLDILDTFLVHQNPDSAEFICETLMRISQTDFFPLSRILPPANIFTVDAAVGFSEDLLKYFWFIKNLRHATFQSIIQSAKKGLTLVYLNTFMCKLI